MKKLISILLVLCIAYACKNDSEEIIPNVRFNAEINLDNPQYMGKTPFFVMPGGVHRYVGVNGVVVWDNGGMDFYAFDLMCTHKHEDGRMHFVEIKTDGNPILKCPECGSEFLVAAEYGDIVKGPAKWPLKRYQTSITGNMLRIWN